MEFTGSAIRALSIEGRLTLCNMSIEAGARCGVVAPDALSFAYLRGRPYAPMGAEFEQAVEAWSRLTTEEDASFDHEVEFNAANIAPIVTWGTSPQDALPIDASVPDPTRESDPERAQYVCDALDYMASCRVKSSQTSRLIACSSAPARMLVSRISVRRRW